MSTATYWRRRLETMRVSRLQFAGGSIHIQSDASSGEGIQYLGSDHVAITDGRHLYLIPYDAIREVSGTPLKQRHPRSDQSLLDRLRPWVDRDVDPDDEDDMLWYSFIERNGQRYRGAIWDVSRKNGIKLKLAGNELIRLAWHQLGAATEVLE